jgi:hypothetical protein
MMNNIDELILAGALEVYGVDLETGEFMYSFTEKLAEVAPEIYENVQNRVARSMKSLWEKGFVSMNLGQEDPDVFVTDKAFDSEETALLSAEDLSVLKSVIAKRED